jgi:hypothetical protein
MIVVKPEKGAIDEKLTDFRTTIIEDIASPFRMYLLARIA